MTPSVGSSFCGTLLDTAGTNKGVVRLGTAGLRIYLYHIPQNSGVPWPVEVVERLHRDHPEVVIGLKVQNGRKLDHLLRDVIKNLQDGVTNLGSSAAQIAATAKQTAASSAEQATTVAEVATTVEEVTPDGQSAEAIIRWLDALPVEANSGDVYAVR